MEKLYVPLVNDEFRKPNLNQGGKERSFNLHLGLGVSNV
jgi:hypothetical protein